MSKLQLKNIKACVFDAYGTLFDVDAAAREERLVLGPNWKPLADMWRTKQLQYTWLRSLQRRHVDFWAVTSDALDFAMSTLNIEDDAVHDRLMSLYLKLSAYPEVKAMLEDIQAKGIKCAILSNGSPEMLDSAVENAGIKHLLDGIYSVEEVGIYKPDPSVYQMAVDHLGVAPDQISFQSSNAWDAYAAKAFGFNVVWCNRFDQADERLPGQPDGQIKDLSELPFIVSP